MKIKPLLILGGCILMAAAIFFLTAETKNYIDTSFATKITLKYYYSNKKIDLVIIDESDKKIIKDNLKGISYPDNPSCGFSPDISITFSDAEKSIVLCPACDGCSKARVGDSGRYINIKDRKALETVFVKYGMSFPCV